MFSQEPKLHQGSGSRINPITVVAALLLLIAPAAGAAPAPEIASEIEGPAATPKRVGESPTTGKVSPHLLQARELVLEGMAITAVEERVSTVTWKDGRMEVEVRLESLGPELL
jgi:hypothetical protein